MDCQMCPVIVAFMKGRHPAPLQKCIRLFSSSPASSPFIRLRSCVNNGKQFAADAINWSCSQQHIGDARKALRPAAAATVNAGQPCHRFRICKLIFAERYYKHESRNKNRKSSWSGWFRSAELHSRRSWKTQLACLPRLTIRKSTTKWTGSAIVSTLGRICYEFVQPCSKKIHRCIPCGWCF